MLNKGTDVQQKVFCVAFVTERILGILNAAVFFLVQVCDWKEPEELAQLLDLELRAAGEPHHRLLERVRDVAKYSIKTSTTAGSHQHTFTDYLGHFISVLHFLILGWEKYCLYYFIFSKIYILRFDLILLNCRSSAVFQPAVCWGGLPFPGWEVPL